MDTKNEINEMLNKKRETERKIEDENKKFREIENELVKKINTLNIKIADLKNVKQNLEEDESEPTVESHSLKKITNTVRDLEMRLADMEGTVDTHHNNVKKMENQNKT